MASRKRTRPARARRGTYRHGDLHHALLAAGVRLARGGGPSAVVLREATRRAGVAPNAAYRHFADRQALLEAVCAVALRELAIAIERELGGLPAPAEPAEAARARLRAVGTGYLRFARAEPGLFLTAFSVPVDMAEASAPEKAGRTGFTPFQLLSSALDDLVAADLLPRERRPGAEYLAWSAVHGLSMLLIKGPLRGVGDEAAHEIGRRLVDMVERGL